MGLKNVMIMVPVVISILGFFTSTCVASFGRRGLTNLPLVHLQDHFQSKTTHVSGQGGSNGGRTPGSGANGNGGTRPGSNPSPYLQGGGAAVIPIYNGGAAANNRRNHHHNAGSCVQSYRGSPAIAAIILAYLL